jgi:hypothetical protein
MQDVALPGFPAMGRGVEERIDRDRVHSVDSSRFAGQTCGVTGIITSKPE